jgi:hypothetical protein
MLGVIGYIAYLGHFVLSISVRNKWLFFALVVILAAVEFVNLCRLIPTP